MRKRRFFAPRTVRHRQRDEAGLTLFELLIVLAIIALLTTLVAPRVIGYLGRAKSDIARAQLASVASSLELFKLDVGRYPTETEGLDALVVKPDDLPSWYGPYLKDESGLTDPWGRRYGYTLSEAPKMFEVYSLGRDGEAGGEGEDADIRKR